MKQDKDKELLKSLKDLEHKMGQLKRYSEFVNRKSMFPSDEELKKDRSKLTKLSSSVEELIYSMTDNGWLYYKDYELVNFYSEITFEKEFPFSEASQDLVDEISSEMDEVVSHFSERKFNCHYKLKFNGKDQSENDPQTHKNDIYTFKGPVPRLDKYNKPYTGRLFYPQERFEELRSGGWTLRMKSYDSSENFIAQIILLYI